MKTRFQLLLTGCISATVSFWIGHLSSEYAPQPALQVNVPEPLPCPECVQEGCPEPVACPEAPPLALHHKVLKAKCDTRVADAYVRGLEANEDACKICEQAVKEMGSCKLEECGKEYHSWSFDMMSLGIQTMSMDVEQSHWQRCCEELGRVWPTPDGPLDTYPEDFPSYCR